MSEGGTISFCGICWGGDKITVFLDRRAIRGPKLWQRFVRWFDAKRRRNRIVVTVTAGETRSSVAERTAAEINRRGLGYLALADGDNVTIHPAR